MSPSLATLTDFVIDRGVDGMTILGVLGEAAKLTDAERLSVIEGVVARAAGRVPICVGVSAPSTARAIGYAAEAQERGAHSVMLAPPQLARPNDAAVRAHYLAVADAIELPVVVQDHPASSGVWMSRGAAARPRRGVTRACGSSSWRTSRRRPRPADCWPRTRPSGCLAGSAARCSSRSCGAAASAR